MSRQGYVVLVLRLAQEVDVRGSADLRAGVDRHGRYKGLAEDLVLVITDDQQRIGLVGNQRIADRLQAALDPLVLLLEDLWRLAARRLRFALRPELVDCRPLLDGPPHCWRVGAGQAKIKGHPHTSMVCMGPS